MELHPVVQKVKSLLQSKGFNYDYFEHEPVRTSEEASKVRPGYTLQQGAKALIVKVYPRKETDSNEFFVMLVIPGDSKFSSKKVRELFNAKDVRFASEEEVSRITDGVELGGVPPFGSLFGLKTYVDKKVLQNTRIVFNAGDKRASIAINVSDYLKVENPLEYDLL